MQDSAPSSAPDEFVLAWSELCRELQRVGEQILSSPPGVLSPLDKAEGIRYLTRLTRGAFESYIEGNDAKAPLFRRAVHETLKFGMDNPDNVYLLAPVNGKYDYRISGHRGTVRYLGFGSQSGGTGKNGELQSTGYLKSSDMQVEADGTFSITASAQPQPGNWLPMTAVTRLIQVRQTRLDHVTEKLPSITIERIDGSESPRLLCPEHLPAALKRAIDFIGGTATFFQDWTERFRQQANRLPRFDPALALRAGGDPNIAYYHGYFELTDDEALVVEFEPPSCEYWNFQLANYWLESLDYRYFPVHLNQHSAAVSADGWVRIVIAQRDPGVSNWLNTCGHNHGTMCLRWVGAAHHPDPIVTIKPCKALHHE